MLTTIVCEYCGSSIEYERRGRVRRTCFSPACVRERARDLFFCSYPRLDAPVEKFRRRDVFERDEWTCYLCGGLTDRQSAPDAPLAPSIEHVHSRRSGHTMDNCQTAHMVCNTRKGTRYYDRTLRALVVTPGSVFANNGRYPAIPFVTGEWTTCPDCGRRVLRSPSGLLSVGPLTHGTDPSACNAIYRILEKS
jgi:5-methylcytosine-specific restriction endonuclease McrA